MTSPFASTAAPTASSPTAAGPPPSSPDPAAAAPRRRLQALAVVGPVVALLLATFIPFGLMQLLLPATDEKTPAGVAVALVVLPSLVVCLGAIGLCAILLRWHGLRLRDAGFRWTGASLPRLLVGLTIGAGVVVAVGVPLTRLGLLRTDEGGVGLPWWAVVIAGLAQAVLLQGLPEELLFRGYQMTALRLRPVAALFVSATVFGLIHLLSNGGQANALERVLYLTFPFGFALTGGALMILTDSLWAAVGVHAGVHVGSLIGVFLGIGDGPQMWVTGGAVWTVIGVALLIVAQRRGRLAGIWRGPQR